MATRMTCTSSHEPSINHRLHLVQACWCRPFQQKFKTGKALIKPRQLRLAPGHFKSSSMSILSGSAACRTRNPLGRVLRLQGGAAAEAPGAGTGTEHASAGTGWPCHEGIGSTGTLAHLARGTRREPRHSARRSGFGRVSLGPDNRANSGASSQAHLCRAPPAYANAGPRNLPRGLTELRCLPTAKTCFPSMLFLDDLCTCIVPKDFSQEPI